MLDDFDPYYKWLAIPPTEQPPNHYRLLGVPLFTADPDVIENAADQRMAHLRSFQSGKYSQASQRLLNEVATARVCLLTRPKKAEYDAELQRVLQPAIPARALQPAVLPQAMLQPIPLPPPVPPPVAGGANAPAAVSNQAATGSPIIRSHSTKRNSAKSPLVEISKHIAASVTGLLLGYLIVGFFAPSWDHFELFHRKPRLTDRIPIPPVEVELPSPPKKVEPVTQPPVAKIENPAPLVPKQPAEPSTVKPPDPRPTAEELARQTEEEKQQRLAKLQTERDAAIAAGEVARALKLTAEVAALGGSDPNAEKARVVDELRKVDLSPAETSVLVRALLELTQHSQESNNHNLAKEQATTALQLARKTSDQDLVKQATKMILEIQQPE